MKYFLRKSIIVVIALVVFNVILFCFVPKNRDASTYLDASIDKHSLLTQTPSPKIIFVGGSNLAFGLQSEKVSQSLHCSTVNMGLHAGLGMLYMVNEIKAKLCKDDIIVLSPEYEQFYDLLLWGDSTLAKLIIDIPFDARYLSSFVQVLNVIKNIIPAFQKRYLAYFENSSKSVIYARSNFNVFGDILRINDSDNNTLNFSNESLAVSGEINKATINILNDFYAYSSNSGCKCLFIFPCIPESQYNKNKAQIIALYTYLQSALKIKILSPPYCYVFPDDYFYDTMYHLNSKGKEIRTNIIISDLKKAI